VCFPQVIRRGRFLHIRWFNVFRGESSGGRGGAAAGRGASRDPTRRTRRISCCAWRISGRQGPRVEVDPAGFSAEGLFCAGDRLIVFWLALLATEELVGKHFPAVRMASSLLTRAVGLWRRSLVLLPGRRIWRVAVEAGLIFRHGQLGFFSGRRGRRWRRRRRRWRTIWRRGRGGAKRYRLGRYAARRLFRG
jgi:hypothetical protein